MKYHCEFCKKFPAKELVQPNELQGITCRAMHRCMKHQCGVLQGSLIMIADLKECRIPTYSALSFVHDTICCGRTGMHAAAYHFMV